jgi:H/ACA ribonucleoprotein complex subunit 3
MKTKMRKCKKCARYTFKDICPDCGERTSIPIPPKYSPEDPLSEIQDKVENGKGLFQPQKLMEVILC